MLRAGGHPRHWPRNSLFGTVFDPLHVILLPLGSTSHNGVASRLGPLLSIVLHYVVTDICAAADNDICTDVDYYIRALAVQMSFVSTAVQMSRDASVQMSFVSTAVQMSRDASVQMSFVSTAVQMSRDAWLCRSFYRSIGAECPSDAKKALASALFIVSGEMNWWPEAFPRRAAFAAIGLASRDYFPGKHGDANKSPPSPSPSKAAAA
ncbi:hypothetical protein QJQ45_023728 [Haematococcus lacustris]|nr:hypothetical protein QJQ45_023728 [Haematococcus lacustris]